MITRSKSLATVVAVFSIALLSGTAYANPGNGNGNHGNSWNHGNSSSHGNSSNKSDKGNNGKGQSSDDHGNRKNYGKPDHVDSDISFNDARRIALNLGLTG